MRGGLDDALSKLARRDELRRRAASGENPGPPPAVSELVEAIAGVITRYPNLGVTVGVEGAGDPVLLHFGFADGTVQVRADHAVAEPTASEPARAHADFEINVDDEPPPRGSHDDQDRFGPTDYDYSEPPTAERPFVTPQAPPPPAAYAPPPVPPQRQPHAEPAPAPTAVPNPMPMANPVPFQAERQAEEAELAARRLAAMLRDNPNLLND